MAGLEALTMTFIIIAVLLTVSTTAVLVFTEGYSTNALLLEIIGGVTLIRYLDRVMDSWWEEHPDWE